MTRLPVSAPPTPEPASWAHNCACAWAAAWLGVRGAPEWRGPRQVLADRSLKRTITWKAGSSLRRSGHRPDLMARAQPGLVAVEVELQRKSTSRMSGIASMYATWIAEGDISGVLYVCANEKLADHVHQQASQAGIPAGAGLWLEQLDQIREQARDGAARLVGTQAAPAARAG